jgi:hypothetical protein
MGTLGTRGGIQQNEEPVKEKRQRNTDAHRELCLIAGKWLRKPGRIRPPSCPYVAVELCTQGCEIPDVFGWNYWTTVLIEVKVSRRDFLRDSKKEFRETTEGIGRLRFYCCPSGLIDPDEIPIYWGLLYASNGQIEVVKNAVAQNTDGHSELMILASIIRREGIKPQLFDYRNKK